LLIYGCTVYGIQVGSMSMPGKCSFRRKLITCEIMAFLCIIVFIWLDEVIDIPHLILGAGSTPLNWRESLSESVIIAIVGAVIIGYTKRLIRRVKILEGFLPVCSSCKKIRDSKGHWHQMELYIRNKSEAEFSHGLCPDCADKLASRLNKDF